MTRRYPAYRDSGVEWLGEVPEGWSISTLKRIVSSPITDGPHETPQFLDNGVPFVSAEAVSSGRLNFDRIRGYISPEDHAKYSLKYAPKRHDIFMIKSGATTGVTAIVETDVEFNIWSPIAVVRCGPKAYPYFVLNFMRSLNFFEAVQLGWSFGTQQNIGMGVIENLNICLPPLPEQTAIAAFLDWETAKIDALVAEQRRLIDLLKEKRQAVISHAVTRGLNPAAKLKPSGVDWLGDVPEGWEIGRLKNDLQFLTSGSRGWADYYADDGAIFIRIGNLPREDIRLDLSDIQRVAVPEGAEGERTKVEAGDVLFSITAYLGSVAVVPVELETAYVSQHVALARLRQEHLLPEWVAYVTLSFVGKTYLAEQGYGGTKVQLSLSDVANLLMPTPPKNEQQQILRFIGKQLAKSNQLISAAEAAITLLQERRAALISAAVTGKIDVRDLAPHQTEAA